LKFLSVDLCEEEGFRKRFMCEARAAARLNHPNIVTVHEVGEFQDRPYITMAYIEGQPLHSYSAAAILPILMNGVLPIVISSRAISSSINQTVFIFSTLAWPYSRR
jgi:serine/threonine protein kinase